MRVRLFSLPAWGGAPNEGFSLYIAYVFAGGGDVKSRMAEYDSPNGTPLPTNVMGMPRQDEIFIVEGVNRSNLQSGDTIQLRTSDGHYVGIDHDEEDHADYVVADATEPGIGYSFVVTLVNDPLLNQELASLAGLDPCGPSSIVTLLGRNRNYLSFGVNENESLDIGSDVVGSRQRFALDYLPEPPPHHHRPLHRRPLTRVPE